MQASQLAQALSFLPQTNDPNLLVGHNTADDAGVYKLSDKLALVYTVDVFAPVVDDPYTFGMIAAANSISDIYAMGGEPKLALNIVGFPSKADIKMLGEMLKGAQDKATEAGVTICGGHTFVSEEIRYGLSVIGYINPQNIVTNAQAQVGDLIVLTKPIGVGTIIQAHLLGREVSSYVKLAIESMVSLNKEASIAMQGLAHAATDITGYGLVGHLVEMAEASKVGIELYLSKVPILPGALEAFRSGVTDPGIMMNYNSFASKVEKPKDIDEDLATLVFGAETSGGLAIALPEEKLPEFANKYKKEYFIIGRVTSEPQGKVKLT
ncbi:MAG: selenide, water dikinase SelD [candidate division WOR-3 bacterium]|nr:selenide, water dikinase SelD [candidate division WOR-3 bacterium]MDW7987640.1 selenide, water dikinase SelD [candidate division WOR-3 bacterium]